MSKCSRCGLTYQHLSGQLYCPTCDWEDSNQAWESMVDSRTERDILEKMDGESKGRNVDRADSQGQDGDGHQSDAGPDSEAKG